VTAKRRLVAAVLLTLGPCTGLANAQAPRRGPIEWHEEWLLAQPRLTLPATSPDLLVDGKTRVRLDVDWGNDFGVGQEVPGTSSADHVFLVDGEHHTLTLSLRHGLTPNLEIGIRLPVRERGGGVLDGVIEWYHGIGFPNNGRETFPQDQVRVEGRREDFLPIEWAGASGTGIGKLELDVRRGIVESSSMAGWRVSAVGRLALPTGTGTFSGGGLEFGAQLVAAHPLGKHFDLFLGAGATHSATTEYQGLVYEANRAHGFATVEWRLGHAWSFLVQVDAAGRHVLEILDYPGIHAYLRVGTKRQLGERWELEAGFGENIKHQQATTDFSVGFGLTRTF
jgi:hypothetical protein